MKYTLSYRIKRMNVKSRQKKRAAQEKRILAMLDREQKAVYDLVIKTAKKHSDKILYDKITGEVLIVERARLFTLIDSGKEHVISIHNHKGFHNQWFPEIAFDHLLTIVNLEAHRYRRGLKFDVRMNIRAFLESVNMDEDSDEASIDWKPIAGTEVGKIE